ncbi:Calpain-A [Gryllus bimaculatus]|nr:Calpain-A [Gryllus bimaculatus]
MLLTEKEKRMMGKLVKDQKYVDNEFSLESDGVERKRPHELTAKPELFIDGPSHMDVKQEGLGDCWFLCVASVIAQHPHLIHQIIPRDQYLYGNEYQGILAFRFWNLGQWKTVYIDDTLPLDENGELIYSRCTKSNEFWLPLLEKAFAKFHGSYSVIEGGFSSEAFLCLSGYITKEYRCSRFDHRQLHDLFDMEIQHNSLIATGSMDTDEEQGIAEYHAYSVTGAYMVRAGDSFIRLVRVRNPWGDVEDSEWKGAFSDKDPKWTGVHPETRKKMEYVKDEDGQFFMKTAHFKKHFPQFTVASRYPNFGDCYETPAHQIYVVNNVWEKGISVVGDVDYAENFLRNPQYLLTVEELDEEQGNKSDEEEEKEKEQEEEEDKIHPKYNVIIELVQEQNRTKYEDEQYGIGVTVFQVNLGLCE